MSAIPTFRPSNLNNLPQAEVGEAGFSRLEASLVSTNVVPRPNSRKTDDVHRHAEKGDLNVNELDFDYSLSAKDYPLSNLRSLQQAFKRVQFHKHIVNNQNYSNQTSVEFLEVNIDGGGWQTLNEVSLSDVLQNKSASSKSRHNLSDDGKCLPNSNERRGRDKGYKSLLLFLIPLVPATGTSFGLRAEVAQSNVIELFEILQIDPLFLLNMIGRPDYWAPWSNWDSDAKGDFIACDFSCQHPRWNLQLQGAPLSVYMRYDKSSETTTYIISHKEGDTNVNALKNIINTALRASEKDSAIFLNDPFDVHVMLSTLSFEASKYHVKRFQRFMWTQINKVDDHLAGLETSNRTKLGELTKQLQVISQNADSHLANADVCIITATGIRDAHNRLNQRGSQPFIHQQVRDSIEYVIASMKKQKLWFLNYKNRKDGTMGLVYNLVTQQDAANNIELAADMKHDSTSMNAIAALTMVFLPGTFTATLLGTSVSNSIQDSGLPSSSIWWIWTAITAPLTLLVIICWWWYKRTKDQMRSLPASAESAPTRKTSSASIFKPRSFSFGAFFMSSRFNDNAN